MNLLDPGVTIPGEWHATVAAFFSHLTRGDLAQARHITAGMTPAELDEVNRILCAGLVAANPLDCSEVLHG